MSWLNDTSPHGHHSGSQSKAVIAPDPVATRNGLIDGVTQLLVNISVMKTVWQERRSLEKLCDWQLKDIGVSAQAAQAESQKKFTDIPDKRRKTVDTDTRLKSNGYLSVKL